MMCSYFYGKWSTSEVLFSELVGLDHAAHSTIHYEDLLFQKAFEL